MSTVQQDPLVVETPASSEKLRVKDHFSALAGIYHAKNYQQPIARRQYPDILLRHRLILDMVVGEQGCALDVGCGSGRLLADLRDRGFQVYGADLSAAMVEASRTLTRQRTPVETPRLLVGDVEALAFRDATFDVVIAAGVLEYLSSDGRALSEIHRVLRPGGVAILSVRNQLNLSSPLGLARVALSAATGALGPLARTPGRSSRTAYPLPIARHMPCRFRSRLKRLGFAIEDDAFYRFDVCPAPVRQWLPAVSIGVGLKLERFARSPLGYLAAGYLIKVRKGAGRHDSISAVIA